MTTETRLTEDQVEHILAGAKGSRPRIEALCRDWLDMRARLAHFGWLTGDTFLDEYQNRYRDYSHDELIAMLASQRGAIGAMRHRIEDMAADPAPSSEDGDEMSDWDEDDEPSETQLWREGTERP